MRQSLKIGLLCELSKILQACNLYKTHRNVLHGVSAFASFLKTTVVHSMHSVHKFFLLEQGIHRQMALGNSEIHE